VDAVRKAGIEDAHAPCVDYCYPGLFQVGERTITIERERISRFLLKLSAAMSFAQYDRLTKTVYIQHMQAERKACAIAEEKPPPWIPITPRRPCGRRAKGGRKPGNGD